MSPAKRAMVGAGMRVGVCVIMAGMIGAILLAVSWGYVRMTVFVVSLVVVVCAVVAWIVKPPKSVPPRPRPTPESDIRT